MKLKFTSTFLLTNFIFFGLAHSQSLSPTVISSTGGFSSNGSAMLSSTTGEMTSVATVNNANVILTQGFQQPEDFNVSVKDDISSTEGIVVSPNPTQGIVKIIFNKKESLNLSIKIYDVAGKILFSSDMNKPAQNNFVSLDLSKVSAGNYVLECNGIRSSSNTAISFSQKITLTR